MSNNNESLNTADLSSDLNEEDRADLVNASKRKIPSPAEYYCDILEIQSPDVRKRVELLIEIQDEYDELEAKCFEEKAAVEAKYQNLYQPLFTKRYEIVNGVTEVEGVANETTADTREDKEKGVPAFWLNAMINNDVVAEEISERDEGALKFVKDIKWSRIENPKGFKLEFFFDTNPYFSNSVLTKTYHMVDEDERISEKAIGTEIEWFPGKSLTHKVLRKKYKVEKDAKPIIRTESCESFFNFFNPPKLPEVEDIDEDMAEELQNQMKQDYEIGSTIRDKIIPRAVQWFTGEAIQEERFEGHEDVDDDDDDDDDDEEDDEEEDEDEDDEMKSSASKKSVRAQLGHGRRGEQPPECKQQ